MKKRAFFTAIAALAATLSVGSAQAQTVAVQPRATGAR